MYFIIKIEKRSELKNANYNKLKIIKIILC
jgi:hypothetical protein